jgi:hypothetical protein
MKTNKKTTRSMTPQKSLGDREREVRRRAYELYERRGKTAGCELQDWLQAESQVCGDTTDFLFGSSANCN